MKKKVQDNTHSLSPLPHPVIKQPPPPPSFFLSHPLTIFNKNTIDTEFLVQIRESDKRGSVRNDGIFNLHVGSAAGP